MTVVYPQKFHTLRLVVDGGKAAPVPVPDAADLLKQLSAVLSTLGEVQFAASLLGDMARIIPRGLPAHEAAILTDETIASLLKSVIGAAAMSARSSDRKLVRLLKLHLQIREGGPDASL